MPLKKSIKPAKSVVSAVVEKIKKPTISIRTVTKKAMAKASPDKVPAKSEPPLKKAPTVSPKPSQAKLPQAANATLAAAPAPKKKPGRPP